jgi:3-oxoacyl-[acyl-carrier protein] reductase
VPAVLVTGATRTAGIAAAVARALASAGWDIATTGHRAYDEGAHTHDAEEIVTELRERGVTAEFHEDDLADPAAPARLLAVAEKAVGPLTGLVNVHTESRLGGVLDATADDFDRHAIVNARSTLLLTAEFARRFRGEFGSGRVVNFTSDALFGEVAYGATKAAVDRITIAAAGELGPLGITVNAVDPGPTDTGWMTPEIYAQIRESSPLGRVGAPDDAARLVVFLLSREGGWITGQVLRSDGGWAVRHGARRSNDSG